LFYYISGDKVMPKKTLALISGLILVTVILFVIALRSSQRAEDTDVTPSETVAQATPTPDVAHSVLSLTPNPVTVAAGTRGSVDVNIDTSDNDVTAVQLELSYDPQVLRNVQITPGPLFTGAVVLVNENDPATGQYTYAFGITPAQNPVEGRGVVATITFTAAASSQPSQITLLPSTLVTARGVATSVLKSSTGTQVVVSGTGGVALPQTQTSTPSAQ
jgi:hypothetical protein